VGMSVFVYNMILVSQSGSDCLAVKVCWLTQLMDCLQYHFTACYRGRGQEQREPVAYDANNHPLSTGFVAFGKRYNFFSKQSVFLVSNYLLTHECILDISW